jgi:hypothetical protein
VAIAGLGLVLQGEHVGSTVDRLIVDGEEDVARTDARSARGGGSGNFGGDDTHGAFDPQDAVFNFVRRGARDHIGEPEREQRKRHRHGQCRLPPLSPPGVAVVHFVEVAQQDRSIRAVQSKPYTVACPAAGDLTAFKIKNLECLRISP